VIFAPTPLAGAFVVDLEPKRDDRGFFAREFCRREFDEQGLRFSVVQASTSYNRHKGIVRGLHFQYPPAAETKIVRCTRGAIFDVIVDLRPESPTYLRHFGVTLTLENRRQLYVPTRFAHGYQVLEDDTEVGYQVDEFHTPELEGGLPHDDPSLGIAWPIAVTSLSDKDRAWPPVTRVDDAIRARMTR